MTEKKLWSPSGVEPNEPIWRVFKEWSDWCRSRKMLSQLQLQESLLAQLVYGVPLLRCLIVSRVTCKTRRVRLEPWMEKREGKEEMLPKKGCRNFQSNNCRVNVTYSHVFLFTQDNLWMNEHHPPSLSTEGMYTYVCLSFFCCTIDILQQRPWRKNQRIIKGCQKSKFKCQQLMHNSILSLAINWICILNLRHRRHTKAIIVFS